MSLKLKFVSNYDPYIVVKVVKSVKEVQIDFKKN